MTSLAVIILNWNGASLLKKFLPSVVSNSQIPGVEVWVADNASADDSIAVLEKEFPEVKYLRFDKNYGFAAGYNKAMQQIECRYAVLLNSDVEVTPGWLEPLIRLMESDSTIAACMPKIKSYHKKDYFEYAGACGGFIDKYGYVFCRGRLFDEIEPDTGQYDDALSVFWATGAAMMVQRQLYIDEGGLDEEFFAHMEEIDLCWRLKNKGYSIMAEPSSTVYHIGAATLSQTNPYKTYLNFRNNLLMMYKNLPVNNFRSVLFKRILLDMLAAGVMLFRLKFRDFFSVIRAHIHFHRMRRISFRKKRLSLLKNVTIFSHPEMIKSNVVMRHFLRQYRKFSDIKRK